MTRTSAQPSGGVNHCENGLHSQNHSLFNHSASFLALHLLMVPLMRIPIIIDSRRIFITFAPPPLPAPPTGEIHASRVSRGPLKKRQQLKIYNSYCPGEREGRGWYEEELLRKLLRAFPGLLCSFRLTFLTRRELNLPQIGSDTSVSRKLPVETFARS